MRTYEVRFTLRMTGPKFTIAATIENRRAKIESRIAEILECLQRWIDLPIDNLTVTDTTAREE